MSAASGRPAHGLVAGDPDPVQLDVSEFLGGAEKVPQPFLRQRGNIPNRGISSLLSMAFQPLSAIVTGHEPEIDLGIAEFASVAGLFGRRR